MKIVDEEMFAVAYSVVQIRSSLGIHSPRVSNEVSLRGPSRVKAQHHGFGNESDEDAKDEEDDESGELDQIVGVIEGDGQLQPDPCGLAI